VCLRSYIVKGHLKASLKNVGLPLCEVPVLTATLLRSRRAVLTLLSVLELFDVRHSTNIRVMMMMMKR